MVYKDVQFDLSELGATNVDAVPLIVTPSESSIYGSVQLALVSVSTASATVRVYNNSNSPCSPQIVLIVFYR